MRTESIATATSILLSAAATCPSTWAFQVRNNPAKTTTTRTTPTTNSLSSRRLQGGPFHASPFFQDEEDCDPQEDECEYNWDFPSAGKSNPIEVESALLAIEDERDIDMQPRPEDPTAPKSVVDTRVHLEVNWQMEECETTTEACEDFCADCAGSGKVQCRFCRGTRTLVFNDQFRPCPICSEGTEDCDPCRGTGFIAPWASTMDNHFGNKIP